MPVDPAQRRAQWIRQQRARVHPAALVRDHLKTILWAIPPVALLLMTALAFAVRLFIQDRLPGFLAYVYYAASPMVLAGAVLVAGLWWLILRHYAAALPTLALALVGLSFALVTMCRFNPPQPSSAASLRLLFWNVAHGVRGWPKLAAAIRRYDPDLVGLVEAGEDVAAMEAIWAEHLPEYHVAAYDTGITILSRRPMNIAAASTRQTWSRYVHAIAELDGQALDFVVFDILHTIGQSRDVAFGPLYEVLEPLTGRAVVVVGDFNTPVDSVFLDRMRREYEHAFEAAGRGYAATWPVPLPLLTIDQAWASPAVRLLTCRHGWSTLSDHRPILLEVAIEEQPATPPPSDDLTNSGGRPWRRGIPKPIRILADAAYEQTRHDETDPDRFAMDFAKGYLAGLTSPQATILGGAPGFEAGVRAGQAAAPIRFEMYEQYFLEWGHTKVSARGVYTPRFESSDFQPDDGAESWWLTFSTYCERPAYVTAPLTVTGFLSPPGHYGHFGGWKHELIVTSISPGN